MFEMIERIGNYLTSNWHEFAKHFTDNQTHEGNLPGWLINEVTFILLLLSTIIAIYTFIQKIFSSYYSWRIRNKLFNDLTYSSFSRSDVEKATQYYIPTKYQNVSPSDDEEPGSKYIASAKNELIPLFINEAFSMYGNDNKYYLILADAGMGKTTFMINLYLAYLRKRKRFWQPPKLKIRLYSLGDPKTLEKLKNIEDKHETILLLDAFDEDVKAIIEYRDRLSNILKEVDDFHDIVITCRTQFFPSEIEEPYSTGYISFGDANVKRNFQKLYISVFNNKDIKKYLRKRIPFYKINKYRKALEIAHKSPSLVVRPMLLSHIEDLANSKVNYDYIYEIYQVLIEKWVKREASKPGLQQKYGKGRYEELLEVFSQELAVDMYLNREKRGGYFATINDFSINSELSINDLLNDSLSETEKRSRSLLNRDAEGKYKFSHKSIMEYFLAKRIVEDEEFSRNFDFKGNDAALLFHKEMLINEVVSPAYELYNSHIIVKCDNFKKLDKLKYNKRNWAIRKSLFYYNKYKKLCNSVYTNDIKIRSGIAQFDFIYKIYLYNKIVRRVNETLIRNSINPNELIYHLNTSQLDRLKKSLTTIANFYFDSNFFNKVNEIMNFSIDDIDAQLMEMNLDKIELSELITMIFLKPLSLFEMLFYISKSDNKSKLFISNQAKLLKMSENTSNESIKSDIELLIGLSFDLFTKRIYGDVIPYNIDNSLINKLDPLFLQSSLILMRISKHK